MRFSLVAVGMNSEDSWFMLDFMIFEKAETVALLGEESRSMELWREASEDSRRTGLCSLG